MRIPLLSQHSIPVFILMLLVWCLAFSSPVQATHIRAGEITAKSDTTLPVANRNPLRYFIKLVQYADRNSQADNPTATITFGDGTKATAERKVHVLITPDTWRNVYYFEHIYPGPNDYTLVYFEVNRSKNVVNMTNSDQQNFLLRTTITIDLFEPINSTPVLLVPPIDFATSGQIYTYNPGAFDPNGDSLAYKLHPSQQNVGTEDEPVARNVTGFQLPNAFGGTALPNPPGGPPQFTIDPISGQLTWNTPGRLGDYNIAIIIEEWRDGIKIGEILRDMQIRVVPTENRPPQLTVPPDICVVAGTPVQAQISATDPDRTSKLLLQAFSGILPPTTFTPAATFSVIDVSSAVFNWTPDCNSVREEPYQVVFKVSDDAPVPLTELKPWNIQVIGRR